MSLEPMGQWPKCACTCVCVVWKHHLLHLFWMSEHIDKNNQFQIESFYQYINKSYDLLASSFKLTVLLKTREPSLVSGSTEKKPSLSN